MLLNNRIFLKDDTVVTDLSMNLNNFKTGTSVVEIVSAEDSLFIGSDFPFNHRYFDVSTANTDTSAITVSYWDGRVFNPAVEVFDFTSSGGAAFAQSGILAWIPDRNQAWAREADSFNIPDLSTTEIYNFYWVKLSFSADLSTGTALKSVTHKFSQDSDLYVYYPDLNRSSLLTAFAAGKTNWNDQHFTAADYIIQDLRRRRIIWSANQILDWEVFRDLAVHKVAEIIYVAFGESFLPNAQAASQSYKDEFEKLIYNIDRNSDGRLEVNERVPRTVIFRR